MLVASPQGEDSPVHTSVPAPYALKLHLQRAILCCCVWLPEWTRDFFSLLSHNITSKEKGSKFLEFLPGGWYLFSGIQIKRHVQVPGLHFAMCCTNMEKKRLSSPRTLCNYHTESRFPTGRVVRKQGIILINGAFGTVLHHVCASQLEGNL